MDKTVPAPAAAILDLIGTIEAPKGYDTVYGNNQGKLAKPITQMTLAELIRNQPSFTRQFGSSASGRYQFMRDTLLDLQEELKLRGGQIFDANLQDRLGYHLLRRRGYDKWIAGKMTTDQFMIGLAMEWASFPVPGAMKGAKRAVTRGQSYYAGDGINKCLVTPERVAACLRLASNLDQSELALEPPVAQVPPPPVTGQKPAVEPVSTSVTIPRNEGKFAWLGRLLKALFHREA